MAKKQNINNNDPISKAVDLLLENTEDLTTVFKEGGLYKELTKRLVEKMLNSEMQNYLGYEKNQHSNTENARNGTSSKKLITQQGKIEIDVPRDRNSDFTPVIVAKRQRRFHGFDQQVFSLYAKGMTLSDIRMQLKELYHGADISESVISQITDDVIDDVKAWQNRPLEILNKIQKNKQNAGRKLIILTLIEINTINHLLITKNYALDIIANFLKENKIKSISTKTLYNMFKTNRMGFDENNLLRKGKNKPHKQKETRGRINNCKSIHERNLIIPNIKNIEEFGHLEGDTIIGKDHKSSIITLADIWSKTTIPLATKNNKSENITKSIIKFISKLQKGTVKTITFDRGKEFSKWKLIEKNCNVKIYFADPGKPCQRGLNENNNSILRRYLPKSTDLSSYKQKDLNTIAFQINSTPRKSLSYKRPIDLIQLF